MGTGRAGFVIARREQDWMVFGVVLDEVTTQPLASVAKDAPQKAADRLHTAFDAAMRNPDLDDHTAFSSPTSFGTVRASGVRKAHRLRAPIPPGVDRLLQEALPYAGSGTDRCAYHERASRTNPRICGKLGVIWNWGASADDGRDR